MSFNIFDRNRKEPLGLPQLRDPCVCSPTDKYCLVCRIWDCEQALAESAQKQKTLVTFKDGQPFFTNIPAHVIKHVHELKARGMALRNIPQIAGINYTQVRNASRMHLVEKG